MSINPYGISPAAGDKMKSIYSNSSANMIIMSFFLLSYIFRGQWFFAIASLICLLLCTYMSGLVIFLVGILFSVLFFSEIKRKFKTYFVALLILSLFVFSSVSPSNVNYAEGYINRIIENDDKVPFKINSFRQTIDYYFSSFKSFFIGAGGGNFSSRVAFIGSGDYVNWFPERLSYASDEFNKNHLSIWNHDFNNKWDDKNNTANQPFSFYNQIMGEYGLVGIFIFLFFYLGYIMKNWNILTYSKFATICLLGYFLLDYWFEYFSVMIIFELLLMLDIKLNVMIR
jgi:ABC-type multidrug transport system fused ATPase/permease subunit